MADGNSAVFMKHKHRHRLSNDIASADNDTTLTAGLYAVLVKKLGDMADVEVGDVTRLDIVKEFTRCCTLAGILK